MQAAVRRRAPLRRGHVTQSEGVSGEGIEWLNQFQGRPISLRGPPAGLQVAPRAHCATSPRCPATASAAPCSLARHPQATFDHRLGSMAASGARCAARLSGPCALAALPAAVRPRKPLTVAGRRGDRPPRLVSDALPSAAAAASPLLPPPYRPSLVSPLAAGQQLRRPTLVARTSACSTTSHPSGSATHRSPPRRTVRSAAAGGASAGGSAAPDQQFSLLRIAGDGNCLFRSLAQGAHVAAQEDATAATAGSSSSAPQLLAAEQETAAASELRGAICRELLSRRWEGRWQAHGSIHSAALQTGIPLAAPIVLKDAAFRTCFLTSPTAGRSCASSLTATTTSTWRACSSRTRGEVRF